MTKEEKAAIRGMMIGDSYLRRKRKSYTTELSIIHSQKQKDYFHYKRNFLETALGKKINFSEYLNEGHPSIRLCVIHRYLNFCLKWLYKNHKKYISLRYLRKINNQGIAFWYMDDGSLYAKKTNGKTHAYELVISMYSSKEEALDAIKFMKERLDVDFTLKYNKGKYSIRCGTHMAKKFLEQIDCYIPECMSYKTFRSAADT